MRNRTGFTLALSLPSLLLPASVSAQLPDPPIRPAPSLVWVAPRATPAAAIPVRFHVAEEPDHTVLGLAIGAGVGLVAGWGFYNAICEAVDNNCQESRFPYLVIGAGLGGSLGALIGSVAD